ncbi:hypothetical protein FB45DRAFT_802989, partial [Roridomyces roridus]
MTQATRNKMRVLGELFEDDNFDPEDALISGISTIDNILDGGTRAQISHAGGDNNDNDDNDSSPDEAQQLEDGIEEEHRQGTRRKDWRTRRDRIVRRTDAFQVQMRYMVAAYGRHTAGEPLPEPASSSGYSDETTCFILISGGTGGNGICSAFGPGASFVLPVSDDAGSSSEIICVLGGPLIGDIQSRPVRLPAPPVLPLDAIRTLLAYRLPGRYSEREACHKWQNIIEGRSPLWNGIPADRKETIRGFLVHFESELLTRASKNFPFVNGSIGNYLLPASQGFFRSLAASFFLFSSINNSQANILPVIVTYPTVTIAAELENGERLVGQCEISHPVTSTSAEGSAQLPMSPEDGMSETHTAQRRNMLFKPASKDAEYQALPSRISRASICSLLSAFGAPMVLRAPNADYIASLGSRDVLVYSIGSLWTSIIPCPALQDIAAAIARSRSLRA